MSHLSLPPPDPIPTDEVWEKLNVNNRQRAVELLAMLAVKHMAQKVVHTDNEVADT